MELAWEQNRIYDIRRWTDDNGKKMICNLMGANGTFVKYNTDPATRDIYEWENQGEASDKGISFNENRDMYSRYLYMRLQCLMVLSPKSGLELIIFQKEQIVTGIKHSIGLYILSRIVC